ncbi:uncharacterized protein LOC125594780 [Brassica napus]|uniref:uncharacterized protein LOC125594780 n=1 Tax=Brassica napus TaxID=3708 RepID=UPI002078CAE4|nr:uncharacterized protein LOC125594780 [Brassica napus]
METEFDTPKVYTLVANLPKIFTNTVEILLQELIQDETGVVQVLTSDNINLNPSGGFTPHHLSRLLRDEQVPESQFLGQKIALDISRELANDDSLREPAFVFVTVISSERHVWSFHLMNLLHREVLPVKFSIG